MKILLINPLIREKVLPNCIPTGLAYVASSLRETGRAVEVLDINAHRYSKDEVEELIRGSNADIFGIGGIITTYGYIKFLAETIKRHHPESSVIAGGPVTLVPHILFSETKMDAIVMGEGEIAILDAVRGHRLPKLRWVRTSDGEPAFLEVVREAPHFSKTIYQREPILNLDTIPFPAYDLFPMDIYTKNAVGRINPDKWAGGSVSDIRSINMTSSRGCPYNCGFCAKNFIGYKWRARTPENVMGEIKLLVEEYGVQYIVFNDDLFIFDKKRVEMICALIQKEGLDIEWGCTGRANLMTKDIVQTMADAGCNYIGMGFESFSPVVLKAMDKRQTPEQMLRSYNWIEEIIGYNDVSFIIGYPSETKETIQETIDFAKEHNIKGEAVFFATAYPATRLYDFALKKGLIRDEAEYIESLSDHEQGDTPLINFTDMTNEELIAEKERMEKEIGAWEKS